MQSSVDPLKPTVVPLTLVVKKLKGLTADFQAAGRFLPMHQQVMDTRMLDPAVQAQVYQNMGQYTVSPLFSPLPTQNL